MDSLKIKRTELGSAQVFGIKLLDGQHQKILKLCDLLCECVRNEQEYDGAHFHQVLRDFTTLAGEHFYAEEEFMRKHGYASLEGHVNLHSAFEEKLSAYLTAGYVGLEKDRSFATEVSTWVHTHLAEEDMHFKSTALQG